MGTSVTRTDPRAREVEMDEDMLKVALADARVICVPLAWFPRLLHATPKQRKKWRLVGDGEGIHWPDLDEDLSVAGLLAGTTAPTNGRNR